MTAAWEPLERIETPPPSEEDIALLMTRGSREDALKLLAVESTAEYWQNAVFLVLKIQLGSGWFKLRIERRDGEPISREWRLFQNIKNQLLGPECEALELYPAESRKIDSANMYHLYGVADPEVKFSFGMTPVDELGGKTYDVARGRSKPASYSHD
ncbi:hypothetical protein RX330_20380 [Bradyrhizobium sp. NDS-1]|uniref:DUF7694 domain-containing protein n=1 Tax=Bradyrhizobium sp. NDS-1 TaxID=3080014 RepID=UPI00293E807A|nr:hypothetical protein [Bradyrhizobium sp. NDS-1]WOH70657.1 hypothetical protein RX330_20380 [Bradyrhizobium sp. NDS-1]